MIITKIFSYKKNAFIDFINKKNKKAEKLGCKPITYSFGSTFIDKASDKGDKAEFIEVFIDESVIKFDGWKFIGIIEQIEDEIFIRAIEEIPHRYRETKFDCEHCQTKRHRKSVFIVKHDNGEYKSVGKNCLDDFVGHSSASEYASHYQWLFNIEQTFEAEEFLGFGHAPNVYRVEDILLVTIKSIEDHGYFSVSASEMVMKPSTKDIVIESFYSRSIDWNSFTESHQETLYKVLEWIKHVEATTDYLFNLKSLVNAEYCSLKHFGYVVSLIPTYKKAMDEVNNYSNSEYVGKVGDKKVIFEGECKGVISFDTLYGVMRLYKILCGGNLIIYKTKNHFCNEGDWVKFSGTIKEHSEYKGIKQTIVTRCKVI